MHKNLITLQCKEWRYKLFHHEQTRSYWLFKYTAYALSKTMVANGSMSSVSSESEMCLKTSRLCWGEGVLEQSNLVMSKLKQQKYHFELTECSNYPKWPCFINTTVTVMSVWFSRKRGIPSVWWPDLYIWLLGCSICKYERQVTYISWKGACHWRYI